MNLPNKLTVLRIILSPFFLAAMLVEFPYHYFVAVVVFVAASITDMLDGKIARKRNLVTNFGKLCDPLADKMLTTAALLAFMQLGLCSVWIVMIVLAREFLITSFRLVASSQGIVIPASIWGKLKTICQMVFSIMVMVALPFAEMFDWNFTIISVVSNVLFGITAVLAVASAIKYIVDGVKVIDINM